MTTVSEELSERGHALSAALYKGSLSAVAAALPPLAEAIAPEAAQHWGLVKTMGRNVGHTMQELTDMGFALDALEKMVAFKSKEIRAAACWALAEIGADRPDNVTGLAFRLAKDEAWEVRDQIAAAYDERIGPAQPRALIEIMRKWSNDADERVRRAPALALIRRARRDRQPVLQILEVLRRDQALYVRKGVVYCLQQAWGRAENPNYGPLTPDSPAFLLRVLREWAKDTPQSRWVVAYTLAHTWVAPYLPDALAILRVVARDPSELSQRAAHAALNGLHKLGHPLLRRTVEVWAADRHEPTVSNIARQMLAAWPTESAVPQVATLEPAAAVNHPPLAAAEPTTTPRKRKRHGHTAPAQNGTSPMLPGETLPAPIAEATPAEAPTKPKRRRTNAAHSPQPAALEDANG